MAYKEVPELCVEVEYDEVEERNGNECAAG